MVQTDVFMYVLHALRRNGQQYGDAAGYEAYVASNVQYQASTDPEYQALLHQQQQLKDPNAEAAMV